MLYVRGGRNRISTSAKSPPSRVYVCVYGVNCVRTAYTRQAYRTYYIADVCGCGCDTMGYMYKMKLDGNNGVQAKKNLVYAIRK